LVTVKPMAIMAHVKAIATETVIVLQT